MLTLKEITSQNLERIRKRNGWTHSEFAELLGINRTTLYLYESGRRVIPTELIYKMNKDLGIEPNDVILESNVNNLAQKDVND